MSVPSYLFYFLTLKLPNKGMDFPFSPLKLPNKGMDFPISPLKLPNKGMEEYSKMILFIPFHSISFPLPKRGKEKCVIIALLLKESMVLLKKAKYNFTEQKLLKLILYIY